MTNLIQSTSAVIDLFSGQLLERGTYYPNGARETLRTERGEGFSLEPMGFTGKEGDDEVGLVYFGERYLMPHLGRWASPDPLQVHAGGGGEFGNSYHYVAGNVLQARDPNGLDWVDDVLREFGADLQVFKDRESLHRTPQVPGSGRSGVTIGYGYDAVSKTRSDIRSDFAAAQVSGTPPNGSLLTVMEGAAGLTRANGSANRYLARQSRPLPQISEAEASRLLAGAREDYLAMARRRSTNTNCSGSCARNPISQAQFDAYGRGVHNALADLAYNSAHYAYGRQDTITAILRNANGDDVAALQGLRTFINGPLANARNRQGDRVQSVNGRRVRTAYIDQEIAIARADASMDGELDEWLSQESLSGWLANEAAEFQQNGPAPPPVVSGGSE